MSNGQPQAHRGAGRGLVVTIGILLLLILTFILWKNRTAPTEPPTPVRSTQPAK